MTQNRKKKRNILRLAGSLEGILYMVLTLL